MSYGSYMVAIESLNQHTFESLIMAALNTNDSRIDKLKQAFPELAKEVIARCNALDHHLITDKQNKNGRMFSNSLRGDHSHLPFYKDNYRS